MNGLSKWKRGDKNFINVLETNDIICVTESWMNNIECKIVQKDYENNFNIIYSCRKKSKNAKRDSGGILIFISNKLNEQCTVIRQTDEDIIWVKINKLCANSTSDTYMCCAYVSPRSSCRYAGDDNSKLHMLYNDVTKYNEKGHVIVLGDLNARTGVTDDFVNTSETDKFRIPPDCDEVKISIDDVVMKTNNRIHRHRLSDDKIMNENGRELLELCKTTNVLIVNGRV